MLFNMGFEVQTAVSIKITTLLACDSMQFGR